MNNQAAQTMPSVDAFMAKWEWLILSRCRDEFRADLAAMLAAAPAASGVHPDALPDGTLSKSTAKRVTALASASVSERARGYHQHDSIEFAVRDLGYSPADAARITAAIEQALTQQRGSASYNAGMAMHWIERYAAGIDEECQLDRIAEAFTTPQPSADAVREYVTELRAQANQKIVMAGACVYDGDRAHYKSVIRQNRLERSLNDHD